MIFLQNYINIIGKDNLPQISKKALVERIRRRIKKNNTKKNSMRSFLLSFVNEEVKRKTIKNKIKEFDKKINDINMFVKDLSPFQKKYLKMILNKNIQEK